MTKEEQFETLKEGDLLEQIGNSRLGLFEIISLNNALKLCGWESEKEYCRQQDLMGNRIAISKKGVNIPFAICESAFYYFYKVVHKQEDKPETPSVKFILGKED